MKIIKKREERKDNLLDMVCALAKWEDVSSAE